MGSSATLYSLCWHDLGQSLKQTIGGLRSHGHLFDVTLAADGRTFPAHKVVLSASSPVLLDLLKVTPCKHPVILLPGVSAADLQILLDFIYNGEVRVHSDGLRSLFQAARVLGIHGLSQGHVESPEPQSANTLGSEDQEARQPSKRTKRPSSESSPSNDKRPRAEQQGNKSTETEAEKSSSTLVDTNFQPATEEDAEATALLEIVHNVEPGPSCNKMPSSVESRSTDGPDFPGQVSLLQVHNLNVRNEQNTHTETFAAIVAAADAAAVAAATLSDKKGSSDQPVACPLCNYIIKQSRNLRRHLEIKHFGGARPKKKGKFRASFREDANDSDTESSTDPAVLDHIPVEIVSPGGSASMVGEATVGTLKEGHSQYFPTSLLQQFSHVAPPILSHQIVASTAGSYAPQQVQILKGPSAGSPTVLASSVTEPNPHFVGLFGTENNRPPENQ